MNKIAIQIIFLISRRKLFKFRKFCKFLGFCESAQISKNGANYTFPETWDGQSANSIANCSNSGENTVLLESTIVQVFTCLKCCLLKPELSTYTIFLHILTIAKVSFVLQKYSFVGYNSLISSAVLALVFKTFLVINVWNRICLHYIGFIYKNRKSLILDKSFFFA